MLIFPFENKNFFCNNEINVAAAMISQYPENKSLQLTSFRLNKNFFPRLCYNITFISALRLLHLIVFILLAKYPSISVDTYRCMYSFQCKSIAKLNPASVPVNSE